MHILAIHMNRAAGRFKLTTDQFQQSGFTGTAGPHNGRDLATGNIHVDTIENGTTATIEMQVTDFDQNIVVILRRSTNKDIPVFLYCR